MDDEAAIGSTIGSTIGWSMVMGMWFSGIEMTSSSGRGGRAMWASERSRDKRAKKKMSEME